MSESVPGITPEVFAPVDPPAHETRALENADVLGDGVERDRERLGDGRDARFAACEVREDRATRRIGEGCQGVVEAHTLIFTQMD